MITTENRDQEPVGFVDKVAWIHAQGGRVLSTRSHGNDVFYLPGGKREQGESDEACLVREIDEELSVRIRPRTLEKLGLFCAQSHGARHGVMIRMACYFAEYEGELQASAEIEELAWLAYADREKCSPVDKIIFDLLRDRGELS